MRPRHADTTHDAAKLARSQALEATSVNAAFLEAGGIVNPQMRARRLAELHATHPLDDAGQGRLAAIIERRQVAAITPKAGKKGRATNE